MQSVPATAEPADVRKGNAATPCNWPAFPKNSRLPAGAMQTDWFSRCWVDAFPRQLTNGDEPWQSDEECEPVRGMPGITNG